MKKPQVKKTPKPKGKFPLRVTPTPVKRCRQFGTDGLTPRQRMFLLYYIGECQYNGTAAMIAAGASEKSAKTQASQTLSKPHIIEQMGHMLNERSKALKISAQTVLMEAWLSYAQCKESGDMRSARGFLEQVGKHVDVQAFRTQLGLSSPDGGPVEFSGIDTLSTDEKRQLLALLERAGAVQPGEADSRVAGVDRGGSAES